MWWWVHLPLYLFITLYFHKAYHYDVQSGADAVQMMVGQCSAVVGTAIQQQSDE
jgi:predicted LPLAT superfamily acyltransferase